MIRRALGYGRRTVCLGGHVVTRSSLSALCVSVCSATLLAASSPGSSPSAAEPAGAPSAGGWSALQDAGGSTLAVALADGSTTLVSVGGPDEATIYDQRRTAAGVVGPPTAITTVDAAPLSTNPTTLCPVSFLSTNATFSLRSTEASSSFRYFRFASSVT